MILAKEFNRSSIARDSGNVSPHLIQSCQTPFSDHLLRPNHLKPAQPTSDHCPIWRQRSARARAGILARGAGRQRRRPQLRVSAVVGLRRDVGRRPHEQEGACARHGRGDEGPSEERRMGRRHGERRGKAPWEKRERQDKNP